MDTYINRYIKRTIHTAGIHRQTLSSPSHYIFTKYIPISTSIYFIVSDNQQFPIFS